MGRYSSPLSVLVTCLKGLATWLSSLVKPALSTADEETEKGASLDSPLKQVTNTGVGLETTYPCPHEPRNGGIQNKSTLVGFIH